LDVLDYLVKPFSFERFLKACNKAKEYFELQTNSGKKNSEDHSLYFFVKCNDRIEKVLYDDLLYVEAMLKYVLLHTEERRLIVYLTMKRIAEQLPSDVFIKVHKPSSMSIRSRAFKAMRSIWVRQKLS
jgi:DNA-binding LytR/AlgR family response regulator